MALALSPDGTQLYAADPENGAVARFECEPGGTLVFVELDRELFTDLGLGGASALAASADGKNLYVAAATDDSVVTFSTVPEPDTAFGSLLALAAVAAIRRRRSSMPFRLGVELEATG